MTEVNEVNLSKGGKMAEDGGGSLGKLIKLIILVLLGLILIGGGIIAAMMFLNSDSEEGTAGSNAAPVRSGDSIIEQPYYIDLGSFVVNLSDGRKYVKTSLQLLLNEEGAATFLTVRMAEVKDLVVSELQTLNSEQLKDPKERELFRQRLLRKIESLLPTKDREWEDPAPVKKVLITEIYLQ